MSGTGHNNEAQGTNAGGRLRVARRAANLSQAELAANAGVSQSTVSKLERIPSRRPLDLIACALAAALGVGVETLWPGSTRAPDSLTAEGPIPSETSGAGDWTPAPGRRQT